MPIAPADLAASAGALADYYEEASHGSPLPLLLCIPLPVACPDEDIETLVRAAGRFFPAGVAGIYDPSPDVRRIAAIRRAAPPGFLVFSGWPHRRVELAAAGADGCISMLASALPAESAEAWAGDARKAAWLAEVSRYLEKSARPVALLKAMMNEMDLPAGAPRRPGDAAPAAEIESAPRLRFRGGAPAAASRSGGQAPGTICLCPPGLYEKCLASDPPAGIERFIIHRAVEGGRQYNHHVQIFRHEDLFWACWSAGWVNEDSPGQAVFYATSPDGRAWSDPRPIAEEQPDGRLRWTAGGFFESGGLLMAIACVYSRARYVDGDAAPHQLWVDLETRIFRRDGSRWEPSDGAIPDLYPNERPRRLPDGRWIVPGVNSRAEVVAAISSAAAGSLDPRRIGIAKIAPRMEGFSAGGTKLTEPSWFRRGGAIGMLLRDDAGSRRLWLSESADGGRSWSAPAPTDFPDATSKFFAMELSDGRIALVSNPSPDAIRRRLLAISLSADGGRTFSVMRKLVYDPHVRPRFPGMHKVAGFDYPSALEHDGRLWIAYTPCKEDVEILSVPMDSL
ncbi:MAG: exo-alpha-sialidase [Planctomycetota bacterium]|nr:exo-alpha-sialidase [Planctomycetota bacterium]